MHLEILHQHLGAWLTGHLKSDEDLSAIGADNLAFLRRRLRQVERRLARNLSHAQPAGRAHTQLELQAIRRAHRALHKLEKSSAARPLFASWREPDHFDIGEPVVIVTHRKMFSRQAPKFVPQALLAAHVVDGCRHHDGCVSAVTPERTNGHAYLGGRGYRAGCNRGEFLKLPEYEALADVLESKDVADQRYAQLWQLHGGCDSLPGYAKAIRSRDIAGLAALH